MVADVLGVNASVKFGDFGELEKVVKDGSEVGVCEFALGVRDTEAG